jgi:protein-S-isoprenylcysteine O-methyltransferase Ste14
MSPWHGGLPANVGLAASALEPGDALQRVQRMRKMALRVLLGMTLLPVLFIDSYWFARAPILYDAIEWLGAVLIFVCICGRTWCTLYIGGRKKRELVTSGPYSLSRNPLYVFTLLGAFGIGAQTGSLIISCWFTVLTFLVFNQVVLREERFLATEFPAEFQAYAARVRRFLPKFSNWRDVDVLTAHPRLIRQTFFDASILLIGIPAADLLETLQRDHLIPILLWLP